VLFFVAPKESFLPQIKASIMFDFSSKIRLGILINVLLIQKNM